MQKFQNTAEISECCRNVWIRISEYCRNLSILQKFKSTEGISEYCRNFRMLLKFQNNAEYSECIMQ
jgi:hypothetical protein